MNKVLNLDVSKNPTYTEIIYGRVGDSQMQKVIVNITDNDQQLDLTGFVITFEGTLNGEQIKVFDSDNVSTDTTALKQGSFSYTFPSSAFNQAGKYSRAYFSIAKDGKRNTTGDFKIFVDENADIDAEEAKTVITEYNKLVTELNDLQKKNIDSLNKDIASVKSEIDKFQSVIDEYEASVKSSSETAIKKVTNAQDTAIATIESTKTQAIQAVDATKNNAIETMNNGRDTAITSINVTKDNGVKAINDSKNEAIVAVDDAVNKLNNADVYSKKESDALYAEKDKTYTKEEVEALIASIKTDPPSWKAIPYQSGFATGDEQPCMYRVIQSLDGVKRVQLKGAVQRTSGSFTDGNTTYPLLLPEEARPQVNQVTLAADDMTSNSKCRVIVLPNGNIQTKTKSGSTTYIYITMEYPIL